MRSKQALTKVPKPVPAKGGGETLLAEVRELILAARESVARTIDSGLTTLYWHVGRRVQQDILREKRADYGEQIVSALRTQLGRTHFRQIIALDDPLKRDFYAEMCRIERWNTRTLEKKMGGMLFERTALSKKPAKLIEIELKQLREEDKLTPDLVFRDPYLLDFLGLKDTYAEKDLEAAILRGMEAFILELGVGFCFVERQKRMQIDDADYYLDLLFFHPKLRRLVAIDLKLGVFEAADKGQMELYLNWLKRHEQSENEEEPLGIILCAGKRQQHVELLEVEASGIRVASYLAKAVPKMELERKLRRAVMLARARLAELKEKT